MVVLGTHHEGEHPGGFACARGIARSVSRATAAVVEVRVRFQRWIVRTDTPIT